MHLSWATNPNASLKNKKQICSNLLVTELFFLPTHVSGNFQININEALMGKNTLLQIFCALIACINILYIVHIHIVHVIFIKIIIGHSFGIIVFTAPVIAALGTSHTECAFFLLFKTCFPFQWALGLQSTNIMCFFLGFFVLRERRVEQQTKF